MKTNFITSDIFKWVKANGEEEITSFIGPFDFAVIDEKLYEIKSFLKENNFDKRKSKLVYSIMVESLENVIKHSEYKGYAAAFMMYFKNNDFFVTVVNPLSNNSSELFLERFNSIKDLSLEEIQERRLTQLKNGTVSDKGGAGLGLMEIFIKTNKNINCEVKSVEHDVKMLVLNFTI